MSETKENNSSSDGIILRELRQEDNVNISLGSEYVALKNFLKKNAKDYHSKNLARTFVAVDNNSDIENQVLGYVTLVSSQISLTKFRHPDDVAEYPYKDYPAVKIARLAVDTKHRMTGLGKYLIGWSIATSIKKIMPFIGCRFLVVDSKPCAISYYEKNGFTLLDTEENKKNKHPLLFIDLHKL